MEAEAEMAPGPSTEVVILLNRAKTFEQGMACVIENLYTTINTI